MARVTTVVIGAVDEGNLDKDFYDILAWLRDASIPAVRPLFNALDDRYDDDLKAAVLLRHVEDERVLYELVVLHNHLVQRFITHPARQAPSLDEFTKLIGATK